MEKQNTKILSRLEILETNQYSQAYMMPPPWLMGHHSMLPPPANCVTPTYKPQELASTPSTPQSTGSESAVSPITPFGVTTPNRVPTAPSRPTTSNTATLVSMKENTPLPQIDKGSLITPQAVVDKYPNLLKESKIPKLSIRLAKEAYFGKEVMSFCTFKGVGSNHALPDAEVKDLKEFLKRLTLPGIVSTRQDFEIVWKNCIESIGQSCKTLRKLRLANMELK